jgi:hypothetical protein
MRKIGVHEVLAGDSRLSQAVVELEDQRVTAFYPFTQEQPMTEWWGGCLDLRHQPDGTWIAFRNGEPINEKSNLKSK